MKKHSIIIGPVTAALLGLAASVLVLLFVLWAQPAPLGGTLSGMLERPLLLFLNWLPIALLCAALGFALANPMYGAAAAGLVTGVMSLINRVKITVRSEPFVPRDIVLVKEAADAMGNYDLSLPWFQAGVLVLLTALFIAAGILLPVRRPEKRRRGLVRAAACLLCLLLLVCLVAFAYSSDTLYESFETEKPYDSCAVASELGFPYYFCYHFSTMSVAKPSGFDRTEAEGWERDYESAPDAAELNVVFVMNEAFSDILNEDVFVFPEGEHPMETYNELAAGENAYAGHIVVPYFGGGTADTEFDVATGMQTNLLNPNSPSLTAFRCVERPLDSLYRVFGSEGYTTCFMHPGDGWFYGRDEVYELLGAQEIYFADDMEGLEYKGSWVTDMSFARLIEQRFEASVESGVPDLTYAVTIQNHMSYTEDKYGDYVCPEVETTVALSDEVQAAVNVYAEGIRDANAMLRELTDYYSAQDEPVLMVFFGDHLPYLGDNREGYRELGLAAADATGAEDPFAAYTAPFLIWCNEAGAELLDFDRAVEALELPESGRISACYLGAAVLELTGRGEASSWFGYLNELRHELPVIHGGAFMDAAGGVLFELGAGQLELLSKMRCWTYYKMEYAQLH